MLIYGLTGGIACGKSAVSQILSEKCDIPIVDCDKITHNVYLPGTWGLRRLKAAFGRELPLRPDGCVDRAALGTIVFADRAKRHKLEQAVGVCILLAIIRDLVKHWAAGEHLVVIDAPTLYETKHLLRICSKVLVVATTSETQRRRLMARDQSTQSAAEQRIASQMPLAEKIKRCDIVISNNGSIAELEETVQIEASKAKAEAAGRIGFPSPLSFLLFVVLASPPAYMLFCNNLSGDQTPGISRL